MKEQNIRDELKGIAPNLSQMKGTEGYSVPPVYFRELQNKVLDQLQNEKQEQRAGNWLSELIRNYLNPRYALALATLVIVVVTAVVLSEDNDTALLASISSEEAYAYVYGHIGDYETMDLYTLAYVEDADFFIDEFSDEEINYAIDVLLEDIDAESLEELY